MDSNIKMSRMIDAVIAFTLISIGALILIDNFLHLGVSRYIWPIFVLAPGAVMLFLALDEDRNLLGMIFPGMIVSGTGLILLFQNTTGWWHSWSYMWTLYPLFVGMALYIFGMRTHNSDLKGVGRWMGVGSIIGFFVFGFLFETLIFHSPLGMTVLPILLIAAGIYLLTRYQK